MRESHDLEAVNPRTGVKVKIQVKTVIERTDRKGELVVQAKKGNGKPYSERDCEYFIGVHNRSDGNSDVYLIANRRLTEYWRSEKPKKGYEWVLLPKGGVDNA